MHERGLTIGIDLGSSATKAALVDPETGVIATATRPAGLHSAQPGWAEAQPEQWWANVCQVIVQLIGTSRTSAAEIVAIACSGMVPAVVLLGSDDVPLGPAMLQNDARAGVEVKELQQELIDVDLLGRTGSALTQQSVAPTIRWLRRNQPAIWHRTTRIVGSYDWLAMRLGASPHVEQNWALESGLFDFADQPVEEVWRAVALETGCVPPSQRPGTVIGQVTQSAAEATGLLSGTPIVVGGADHVLSAYGAGVSSSGQWLIKLGGAGDILAASKVQVLDERLYLDAHPVPGIWLPNGCMATSGSLLRWLQAMFGDPDLASLDHEAEGSRPAGMLCLPYFLGEKSPLHDPDLRGAFVGLHLGSTRADLHRASLEAIAYGVRQHREIFLENGMDLANPYITNGGSSSALWKQIMADVLQCPVVPVVGHPGASLGAAVAAAVGVGLASWDAIGAFVQTGEPLEPRLTVADAYTEGYELYVKLQDALQPFSHSLARRP